MTEERWHSEFDPAEFLGRVDLDRLIERNEAYNQGAANDANTPCVMCGNNRPRGILLNDKSFLCDSCYADVSKISYPEKYERARRQFLIASEAHRLACDGFRSKYEVKPQDSMLVVLGWLSIPLAFVNVALLVVPCVLLVIGYAKNASNKHRVQEWLRNKDAWEHRNPSPTKPILKHFHDPTAELTRRDESILHIFNHWPGYPPFWSYLREVVLKRDGARCQVTGCPSRLELHIHHIQPVSKGGEHAPSNLIALCDFHHALEPEKGHERVWGAIKTRYFTLVSDHERSNRSSSGYHHVRAHLRRLQLVSLEELKALTKTYGFACPHCNDTHIQFTLFSSKNVIEVSCPKCFRSVEGPQQLTEETGPRLAELLSVNRNQGRWKARWDMLAERTGSVWGSWHGAKATRNRKAYKTKLQQDADKPLCPKCGAATRLVRPRPGDAWEAFWGCTQFRITGCRGSVRYDPKKYG